MFSQLYYPWVESVLHGPSILIIAATTVRVVYWCSGVWYRFNTCFGANGLLQNQYISSSLHGFANTQQAEGCEKNRVRKNLAWMDTIVLTAFGYLNQEGPLPKNVTCCTVRLRFWKGRAPLMVVCMLWEWEVFLCLFDIQFIIT